VHDWEARCTQSVCRHSAIGLERQLPAPWPHLAPCCAGAVGARATASPPPARRRQEYLAASGVPYTALLPCCFFDNYAKTFVFQPQPDGSRTWSDNLGTAPLLMHAVADIGQSAARAHRWPLLPGVLIAIRVPRCSTLAQRPTGSCRPASGSARLAALVPPERLYWGGCACDARRVACACAAPMWHRAAANAGCMRARRAVVFADPEKYAGQTIPVVREAISWTQVADILTEVTGTKVRRGRPAAGRRDAPSVLW